MFGPLLDASDLSITLFARELAEDSSINLFSVSDGDRPAVKYRCVVYHDGHDSGTGSWKCDRDGDDGCRHVTRARHYLQQLVQQDPSARDPLAETQNISGMFLNYIFGLPDIGWSTRRSTCISWRTIGEELCCLGISHAHPTAYLGIAPG